MAVLFTESGTDATQDLVFFSSTSGTVASATDQARTGPRSIKFSLGNPATLAFVRVASVLADAGRRVSFGYRFDGLPTSDGAGVFVAGTTTAEFFVGLNINGTLVIKTGTTVLATGATVLSVNTWYRLCVSYYVTNSTTFAIRVYLDGVLEVSATTGTLGTTGQTTADFRAGANFGIGRTVWVDDVYIDDGASSSSQPDTGDVRVTAKRPNANGTTTDFSTQVGSGGSGYGTGHAPQVNEQPLNTTNGWSVVNAGSAVTEEYNVEALGTGDVDLSAAVLVDVLGWVYGKALTAETGQIVVNGATSNIALTSTNTLFFKSSGATAPAGTGTDIGLITDTTVTTVTLYECGLLLSYRLPTASGSLQLLGVQ